MKLAPLLVALLCLPIPARAEERGPVVPLWPKGAPGSEAKTAPETGGDGRVTSVHQPSLSAYLPPRETATDGLLAR